MDAYVAHVFYWLDAAILHYFAYFVLMLTYAILGQRPEEDVSNICTHLGAALFT